MTHLSNLKHKLWSKEWSGIKFPSQSSNMPFTPKVLQTRERTPTPYPSAIFIAVESTTPKCVLIHPGFH
jgi:hypothetical protein